MTAMSGVAGRLTGLFGRGSGSAVALLAAAGICLTATPAALAAPGWVAPATLTSGTSPQAVQIASDAKGDTAVVWSDGSNVWEAERPAGGSWSAGSKIDTVSADTPQALNQTGAVGMDDSGLIYVFFIAGSPSTERAVVATKQVGAPSWAVTTLEAHCSCAGPSVPEAGAVSPSGRALAVWVIETNPNAGFQTAVWRYATKPANSSTWSTPANLGSSGDAFVAGSPALAIDSAGDAAFVFSYSPSGPPGVVEGATLPAGGSWTPVSQASAGAVSGSPAVVNDSSGNATAVFTTTSGVVSFATRTASGSSWSSTTGLSPSGATSPALAIQPDGATTVGWIVGNAIGERTRPAGTGSFNAATTIPNADTSPSGLTLATGGDSSMVALWGGLNGSSANVVSGARRGAGAPTFSSLPDIPGTGNSQPVAGGDGQGDVGAAWVQSGTPALEAAGLVTAPPTIGSVSFPTTATVGSPFSYAASITPDQWTTATGVWAFGDGTTGPLSGMKSYSAPGTFTVNVTATDPFGNFASKAFLITATAPTGTGGGGGGGAGGGGGGAGGKPAPPGKPHLHSSLNRKTHTAKFTFSDPGATGFQCSLVRLKKPKRGHKKSAKPRYGACRSPGTYKHLAPGSYEFFVRGKNSAGTGGPATFRFRL